MPPSTPVHTHRMLKNGSVVSPQQFFQGFHMTAILPSTIPIDGRPSGEAYVQFSDVNETWRALQTRNGARMDRRYIELFPASKQEMNFAAQGGDPRAFRERERVF